MNLSDVANAEDFDRWIQSQPYVYGPCGKCACCGLSLVVARVCIARVRFAFTMLATVMPNVRSFDDAALVARLMWVGGGWLPWAPAVVIDSPHE